MAERLEKPTEGLPQGSQPEKIQQTPDPRPHSVELDALRGIGALGVVITHALGPWYKRIEQPLIVPLLNIDLMDLFLKSVGPFCLGLFFLISGYLLVGTEGRRASEGNYSLRSYALRRVLRLVPAYYFALAVVFLLWPTEPTLTDTLLHLAFLQTFSPDYHASAYDPAFWPLTSALVFYAMLPLLVLKLRGLYPRLALFGVLVAVSLTINVYANLNAEPLLSGDGRYYHYLSLFPLRHLWLFMAGVMLRVLVEHLGERSPGGSWPTATFLLFVGPLVLLPLFPYIPFLGILTDPHLPTVSLAIPFFAAAVLGSPVLSRILSWRLLGFVGMISYSLYLLHETVLMLVRIHLWRSPARPLLFQVAQLEGAAMWIAFAGYLGIILVVCGAVAYLSYRYVESPFLRHKPK